MNPNPKVSVYIPIYNVSKYIERCARSLFEQTLNDIEFIFVDDCSPDDSVNKIEKLLLDYPDRKKQVKIIKHSKNQGIAATRKTGLSHCKGIYVIPCDSDDWIEKDMYEKMYNIANSTNADIVQCDFLFEYKEEASLFKINEQKSNLDYINDTTQIFTVWNRLVKRDLIEKYSIYPYKGINMYEDMSVVVRYLYYSKVIKTIHEPLYHYNKTNVQSMVSTELSLSSLDQMTSCIFNLHSFLKEVSVDDTRFIQNRKNILIRKILDNKRFERLSQFRDMTFFYIRRNNYSFIYRILVCIGLLGFSTPIRFYSKIRS